MKTSALNYKLLIILIICNFLVSFGQTTLYFENFNSTAVGKGIDGVTTNTAGITNWSINYTGSWSPMAAGEYFKVVNVSVGDNVFESFNTDAPGTTAVNSCVWSTTLIAISGFSNVAISVDLSRNSSNSGSGCQAYYSLDGAADVSFGSCIGTSSNTTAVVSGLCGSTLLVKVYHWGISATPKYRHDNVLVTGVAIPEPSSYPSTFLASPGSNCTQLDLSFSAFNTLTNASGYLIIQKQGSLPSGAPADHTGYSVGNTIGDGTVAAIITNASSTSATISGLSGNTSYYYKIFPYYYNGSTCTYNYYTGGTIGNCNATTNICVGLSTEPSSSPAVFTAAIFPSCGQLALNFSAGSTITNCYGYLILRKSGSSSTAVPVDANAYAVGSTISDATVIANINSTSATTYTDSGLSNATQYYYYIFPYNYDGSNAGSYNYKISSALTANQVTIWCEDLVGNSNGNTTGDYHIPGAGPHGNYANWWSVNLYNKADMHNGSASSVHNIISSICVDLNRADPSWPNVNTTQALTGINIYMANYFDVSTFPSAYTNEATLNAGTGVTWTLVYSGNITFAGFGWNQINLSTPFYYNGTGSLLVKFTRVSGNTPSLYPDFALLDAPNNSQIRNLNQTQTNSDYKYMKMAFNSACTGSVGVTGVILPIELTRFEGDCNNGQVILTWQTASERNNQLFNIEHSIDGVNFEVIGTIKGAGTSEKYNNYSFIDDEKSVEFSYYRLSQMDYNGKMSQSNIISVEHSCGENLDTELLIYPNPSVNSTVLSLMLMNTSSIYVEVYNAMGQLIKITPVKMYEAGLQELNLETNELPTGIYFIKTIVDSKEYIQKFVKL